MMNKVLLAAASTLEAVTGIALIVAPSMVRLLLGTDISGATLTIARIVGFGLLLLGVACWPRVEANVPRLRAMLIYNLLATVYSGYLRFGSESVGKLLLPAVAGHAVLAILSSEFCSSISLVKQANTHGRDCQNPEYHHRHYCDGIVAGAVGILWHHAV